MKILDNYNPIGRISKEQEELISVIVAVYNIEDYIERGVNSILNQSYKKLEIILVDDGSTDASAEICDMLAEKDDRIVLIHKENGGLADARNAGLAIAEGSLIGFVDGDDWIDEDMYEKMFGAMLEQEADMAVCRYRQLYKDGVKDESMNRIIVFEGQEMLQSYVEERDEYNIQNAVWNKLYRRELVQGIKFPTGRWYEDIMFTTKALSRAKRCVYLDTACYNYIIDREGSIMNAQINARIFTDLIPTYRRKTEFLKEIGRQDLADIHDYFVYKRLLLFYNQVKKSRRPDRKQYLKQLTAIIKEKVSQDGNRDGYERIYQCSVANPNEKRKMSLFLKSPQLYWLVMLINEAFILPVKIFINR